jgi:serine protease Do
MRNSLVTVLVVGVLAWLVPDAVAQTPGDVFRQVIPSVVVIRAKGRDVAASGQTRFNETGSGVLITADGKVMTAAHVVHSMDEILVEFLGGETVSAKVVASEPAADLSLLQLERVPRGPSRRPSPTPTRSRWAIPSSSWARPTGSATR